MCVKLSNKKSSWKGSQYLFICWSPSIVGYPTVNRTYFYNRRGETDQPGNHSKAPISSIFTYPSLCPSCVGRSRRSRCRKIHWFPWTIRAGSDINSQGLLGMLMIVLRQKNKEHGSDFLEYLPGFVAVRIWRRSSPLSHTFIYPSRPLSLTSSKLCPLRQRQPPWLIFLPNPSQPYFDRGPQLYLLKPYYYRSAQPQYDSFW
jgi:hypothetical protein